MTNKKTRNLTDLKIEEVSMVDAGANPRAHIVFYKGAKMGMIDSLKSWVGIDKAKTTGELLRESETMQELFKLRMALEQSVHDILNEETGDEQVSLLQRTVQEFSDRAKEVTSVSAGKGYGGFMSTVEKVLKASDVPDFNQDGKAALAEALSELAELDLTVSKKVESEEKSMTEKTVKTFSEVLEGLEETQREVIKSEIERVQGEAIEQTKNAAPVVKAEQPVEEDVLKGLPEDVRKRIENAESRVAKLEKENLRTVFVEKSRDLDVGDFESVADVLEALSSNPEAMVKAEQILSGISARLKKTELMAEVVGSANSEGKPEDRSDAITKRAKEIESDDKVAYSEAYKMAMKEVYRQGN